MSDPDFVIPADLGARATAIGTAYDASTAACADRAAAEVDLFARVIEVVRPALPSLASRILNTRRTSNRTGGVDERTYHAERGVRLAGEGPEENREHRDATRGSVGGADYHVLCDGQIARVTYTGSWSRWQGEGSHFESTFAVVEPAELLRQYALEHVVGELIAAIDRAGDRSKATAAATARAAQLRALATLLGGGK